MLSYSSATRSWARDFLLRPDPPLVLPPPARPAPTSSLPSSARLAVPGPPRTHGRPGNGGARSGHGPERGVLDGGAPLAGSAECGVESQFALRNWVPRCPRLPPQGPPGTAPSTLRPPHSRFCPGLCGKGEWGVGRRCPEKQRVRWYGRKGRREREGCARRTRLGASERVSERARGAWVRPALRSAGTRRRGLRTPKTEILGIPRAPRGGEGNAPEEKRGRSVLLGP